MGYVVQWRVICNADVGAHSTRTRLYLIARRDGQPIVWPKQTHAKKPTGRLKAHRPASECIDWSIPGKSIFDRKRPLAEATMRRIAFGMDRFVLKSAAPFIVNMAHGGKLETIDVPMSTIATEKGGCRALVAPTLVQMGHGQGSGKTARRSYRANDIAGPLGTVTASGGGQGVASAFMVQANGGFNTTPARDLNTAMSTVTTTGSQQQLCAAHMVQMGYGERPGQAPRALKLNDSLGTVVAGGIKHGLVQYQLSQVQQDCALQCAAFLMRYHGSGGQWSDLREPMTTVTTRDRLALVTVWLKGEPWVIVDITLRMLVPRELYRAQDFPENYVIDRTLSGKRLTQKAQVRMVGNSVSPLPMRLLIEANYSEQFLERQVA